MSKFDWSLCPQAEAFLQAKVSEFLSRNQFASDLALAIEGKTSTHFFDWIDHITLPLEEIEIGDLDDVGFRKSKEAFDDVTIFGVQGSILFPILLSEKKTIEVTLGVEDIEKFRTIHSRDEAVEGQPNAPLRKMVLNEEDGRTFSVVERNGSSKFIVQEASDVQQYGEACRTFESRQREFESDEKGLVETRNLVDSLLANLDEQRVADAFFSAERVYWLSKNSAAKVQKARQDELGLGWGNRDHHTFRSSRANFQPLIGIFELMGLKPRERFHAGAQAGWGAQILEDDFGRNVVFADVDLDAQERETDFAHQGLSSRATLGTVGLWVGLHGESILQAGMHHLAARFRFEDLTEDLKLKGVSMMKPFSNFPFLKQAFSQAENWLPKKQRTAVLESKGLLSREQVEIFTKEGTLGSHLENIQRAQGFKGFNQDSVSAIIKWTDPRTQAQLHYA